MTNTNDLKAIMTSRQKTDIYAEAEKLSNQHLITWCLIYTDRVSGESNKKARLRKLEELKIIQKVLAERLSGNGE